MKSKIENWFTGDQNYQQGVALLVEAGFTKGKILKNLQRGESKTNKEKLAWELCEIAKLDRSMIKKVNTNVADNRVSLVGGKRVGVAGAGRLVEPPIITRIKEKLSEFYKLRAQLHNEMAALGLSNDAEVVTKREEFAQKIEELTAEIDRLFAAKEKFFREKILPTEAVFEAPGSASGSGGSEMTEVEAIKRRNSLRSQITKAKNKLNNEDLSAKKKKAAQEKLNSLTAQLLEVEKLIK